MTARPPSVAPRRGRRPSPPEGALPISTRRWLWLVTSPPLRPSPPEGGSGPVPARRRLGSVRSKAALPNGGGDSRGPPEGCPWCEARLGLQCGPVVRSRHVFRVVKERRDPLGDRCRADEKDNICKHLRGQDLRTPLPQGGPEPLCSHAVAAQTDVTLLRTCDGRKLRSARPRSVRAANSPRDRGGFREFITPAAGPAIRRSGSGPASK